MPNRTILLVDDDASFRARVREALGGAYQLTEAASEAEFRRLYWPYGYALVILDMRLREGREGLDLLREIYALDELQPTIMVSGYGTTETTIEALESGALMFLNKEEFTPGLIARVVEAVMQQGRMKRRLAVVEHRLQSELAFDMIGMSFGIIEAVRKLREAANEPGSTAILIGEGGTGRKLAARLIHAYSPMRAKGSFVAVAPDVLRGEGADLSVFGSGVSPLGPRSKGVLEQAHGGVLSLEELSSCPPAILARIFAALQQRRLSIAGTNTRIPVDSQLVVASRPREEAGTAFPTKIAAAMPGSRLIEIKLPPLRERKEDISLLVPYFVQDMRRRGADYVRPVSRQVLDLFADYPWPSNVRELKAVLEYAEIRAMSEDADEILPRHLPCTMAADMERDAKERGPWDYRFHVARGEVELAQRALSTSGFKTKSKLAAFLGYNDRFTFQRRLRRDFDSYPELVHEFPEVAELFPALAAHLAGSRTSGS